MADKTGTAFDKEQVTDLSAAVKALCNNLQAQWDETSKIFNELRGEDIVGESEQKTPIIESINIAEDAWKATADKLQRMVTTIDSCCESMGVAVSKNVQKSEDAMQLINSAAAKAKASTGAGA